MRTRGTALTLASLAAAAVLALAGCGGDDNGDSAGGTTATTADTGAGGTTLHGSVGPGFEIHLDGTDGITAGTYTLVVDDMSASHNFHLTGPGVDVKTEVGAEGQETFTVTLQAGEYRYQCDPHSGSMNGSFTVS